MHGIFHLLECGRGEQIRRGELEEEGSRKRREMRGAGR
jgi:hypothetical protein